MNFIALDLETTGLSPETDTIIEIAAIHFTIEMEEGNFIMKNSEERSMLIHPGRTLEQEVSMITGITSEMLIGKPSFESVREKVRDFIGDATIIGHNVLFDIAMLKSHGIDLKSNRVIDTFELSEIFSQDIESLNLGFLANRYGLIDPNETEHRALTDTKVSIRLFLRYLGEIRKITGKKKQIWDILISKDESHTLITLSHICHQAGDIQGKTNELFQDLLLENPGNTDIYINDPRGSHQNNQDPSSRILIETHGNPQEEIQIIKDIFKTHTHINLIVPGYKVATWMSQFLTENSIENTISIAVNKWCSVEHVRDLLTKETLYSRKKIILILKIAFWLTDTRTGLLDELKFYGEERTMLNLFHMKNDEWNIWREQYEKKIKNIPILISNLSDISIEKNYNNGCILIKDIPLIEDIIRRKNSREISFDEFYSTLESLGTGNESIEMRVHISDMLSIIRNIYESVPERPTGPLISPPGSYGETYFITQDALWQRGHKWLIHATNAIVLSWKNWKTTYTGILSRELISQINYIDASVQLFTQYHIYKDTNTNVILSIHNEKTKITFIPKNVKILMKPLLDGAIAYGINISSPQIKSFLMKEYDYTTQAFENIYPIVNHGKKLTYTEYHADIVTAGTVILTTSQKHARDIGQVLRKLHGKKIEILIQGLSGGKGKMLSTFKKNIEKTVLVGIIDTWDDDYELWKSAQAIIIAKLPFDPPTDPYFLARTIGMNNNFSEYSEPIVTIRLNTLIERILASGYTKSILVTDTRLIETEWGKRIAGDLL